MSVDVQIGLRRGELRLDVEFASDGVTVIMGPNGAGKTLTLLQAIVGALRPDRGRILLDGRTLFDDEARVNLPIEARRVAFVPQGFALFSHLTVLDNVRFAARGRTAEQREERARALLAEFGLTRLASAPPGSLSGGEAQRVALARAMAAEPHLLLLDEPLSALDATSRPKVRRSLSDWLWETDVPALVVTHDPADAKDLAADMIVIEAGRVVQRGAPEDVAVRPASEFVAALTAGLIARPPLSERPPPLSEDE